MLLQTGTISLHPVFLLFVPPASPPALSYNVALCYYSMKNYPQALKYIEEIIDRGIREHPGKSTSAQTYPSYLVTARIPTAFIHLLLLFPELSVGMTTEGIDIHSVGNTLVLHQTALIEAFNLKAAVEYQLKNCEDITLCPCGLGNKCSFVQFGFNYSVDAIKAS